MAPQYTGIARMRTRSRTPPPVLVAIRFRLPLLARRLLFLLVLLILLVLLFLLFLLFLLARRRLLVVGVTGDEVRAESEGIFASCKSLLGALGYSGYSGY